MQEHVQPLAIHYVKVQPRGLMLTPLKRAQQSWHLLEAAAKSLFCGNVLQDVLGHG